MLAKYLVLMKRSLGLMLEYRAGFLIWTLTNVMPLVMLAVWYSLAEGGPIAGYSQTDFISYYVLLTIVREMVVVWVIHELDYDIRHGNLSVKLLYPLNPIHAYITDNLADKVMKFALMIPFAIGAWLLFPAIRYDITPLTLVIFVITLFAAWLMRFLSQYTFGLGAFWISQAMTLHEIWYALWMLLGGLVAPIDLFPAPVAAIARYLPFRYMLSFPVEVMMGRLTTLEMLQGVALSVFWVAGLLIAYRFVWRRGIRQFSAFGA